LCKLGWNRLQCKVKLIIISNDTGATILAFNTVPQSSS
jgi:hypothetical protein